MGNGGIQIGHLDTDIFPIQTVHKGHTGLEHPMSRWTASGAYTVARLGKNRDKNAQQRIVINLKRKQWFSGGGG
jgi:hypothetical protein